MTVLNNFTPTCIPRLLGTFAALFSVLACTQSPENDNYSFLIFDENGITIAETTGGPKYEGELFVYDLISEVKEDEEVPESLLHRAYDFCIDQDGCFYVAHGGDLRLAVYDPSGAYQRSFGRRGEGPGEFLSFNIQAFRENVLSLWDSRTQRATYYQTDGTLLNVLRSSHSGRYRGLHQDSDGFLYHTYYQAERTENLQYGGEGMLITTADGDSFAEIKTQHQLVFFSVQYSQGEVGASPPFGGSSQVLLLNDDKILASTGIEPELHIFKRDGHLVEKISLDLVPEVIGTSEKSALKDSLRTQANRASSESSREILRSFADHLTVPETKVFWAGVHQDDYGYYWLTYPNPSIAYDENVIRYRVLSPLGEYLGDTTAPSDLTRVQFGRFLTFRTDQETGQSVPVIYRIHSLVDGFVYP